MYHDCCTQQHHNTHPGGSAHAMLNCATVWACRVRNKSLSANARTERRECEESRERMETIRKQTSWCWWAAGHHRTGQERTGQVSWCLVPEVAESAELSLMAVARCGGVGVGGRSPSGMDTRQSWHICSAAKHRSTLAGQNVDCMEGRPHTCTTTHTRPLVVKRETWSFSGLYGSILLLLGLGN